MQDSPLTRFEAANTLEDIHLTLSPRPLLTQQEIDAFYRGEVNDVRGGDTIKHLILGLKRACKNGTYYKACLMGHQGVGKSTELTRLINSEEVSERFLPFRFSVTEFDSSNFNPLDVLLFTVVDLVEKTAEIAERRPSDENLQKLWDWFSTEEITREITRESEVNVEAGAGATGDSVWNKMLGLFASLKGEIRFASSRKQEVIDYRFRRSQDLINIVNELLGECDRNLQEQKKRQWLVIGEDFDRVSTNSAKALFVDNANIFTDLKTHLVFNLPFGIYNGYADINTSFKDKIVRVLDTPVFHPDHTANLKGREAIEKVLEARVKPELFESGQIERLIIASGGNIRDLFTLISTASDEAILSERTVISSGDVTRAINTLRTEYALRLGQNLYDIDHVSYADKADRLKQLYDGNKEAQIPDEILYSLLKNRSIQEVDEGNGECCFMVHPLVVDILHKQGHIESVSEGGVLGGTSG